MRASEGQEGIFTRPSRRGACVPLLAFALAALAWPCRAQDAPARASEGQRLFNERCSACHTLGAGDRVGPDLQGVGQRREAAWLARWLRDPEAVRQSGDPVALENMQKFPARMPNLSLPEPEVEALVAFLGAGAVEPAPTVAPRAYVPTLAIALLAALGLTVAGLVTTTKKVEALP